MLTHLTKFEDPLMSGMAKTVLEVCNLGKNKSWSCGWGWDNFVSLLLFFCLGSVQQKSTKKFNYVKRSTTVEHLVLVIAHAFTIYTSLEAWLSAVTDIGEMEHQLYLGWCIKGLALERLYNYPRFSSIGSTCMTQKTGES